MLGAQFAGNLAFADHHESHAASAFFPSPFDEAAILTLDGVGEWSTSSIGIGNGNRIELSAELRYPHSLGLLYSAFTYYTGFKVNSGEYKLMGLAPYGDPKYVDLILEKLMKIHEDGSVWLDLDFFDYCYGDTMTSDMFHELFGGPPRREDELITQREMDLAASVQVVCETAVLRCVQHAHDLTGAKNLVMAGGVALNCVANGRVVREGPFEHLWVQPAAGDSGGAVGAALLMWHHVLDQPRSLHVPDAQHGSLLGPAYREQDVKVYLESVGAVATYVPEEEDLLDAGGGAARAGKRHRLVPGPHGVRAAGARFAQHHR